MTTLTAYQRFALRDNPHLYVYALHQSGANALEVGLCMESANRLQRRHVQSLMIHERDVDDILTQIERGAVLRLQTGPLKDHFDGAVTIDVGLDYIDEIVSALCTAASHAFGGAFGGAIAPSVDLSEHEFLWLLYDRSVLQIKIGLGVYKPDGTRLPGGTCYALPRRAVKQFAVDLFQDRIELPMPDRAKTTEAPAARARLTSDDKKLLAVELIRLFDLTKRHGE